MSKISAVAMVFCLLVLTQPVGTAWHVADDPPSSPPTVSADDVPQTGVRPIDRTANETVTAVTDHVGAAYTLVGESVGDVDSAAGADQPIRLYKDGMGIDEPVHPDDSRVGGFGEWTILGSAAWDTRPNAAADGNSGFTVATTSTGLYSGRARSLLVSPEIDLRTNPAGRNVDRVEGEASQDAISQCNDVASEVNQAASQTPSPPDGVGVPEGPPPAQCDPPVNVPERKTSASTVYNYLYWSCGQHAGLIRSFEEVPATAFVGDVGAALEPECLRYQALLDPQHTYASFEFDRRFNVGTGVDGVQVLVFDHQPASITEAFDCPEPKQAPRFPSFEEPSCRVVTPMTGYGPTGLSVFNAEPAFTGFSDWNRDAIDLTPWEGRSVWVAFLFASAPIVNPAYFENPERFVQGTGFVGMHLDNIEVQAPAAPTNLRVRPLTEPSFTPPGFERPAIAPGALVPVEANVTNLATRPVTVVVHTQIVYAGNRTLVADDESEPIRLDPGAYLRVRRVFDSLERDSYSANVCVERTDGPATPAGGFCDAIPPAGTCSGDRLMADPCAQIAERPFEVRPVVHIESGAIQRSADRIQVGDSLTVAMPLTNLGNTFQEFMVRGHLVDTATSTFGGDDLIDAEDRAPRAVSLAPGETETLQWEIQGKRRGQYRFFATLGDAPPYNAEFDLLPQALRPWSASKVPAGAVINVDALLSDWTLAPPQATGLPATRLLIANNDTVLFVALQNTTATGLVLFVDDKADHELDTRDLAFLVNATEVPAVFRHDSAAKSWVQTPLPSLFAAKRAPHLGALGEPVPDRYSYEFRVPLGSKTAGALATLPGGLLGLALRLCDNVTVEANCERIPLNAPLFDGEGLLPPDGSVADELSEWGVARLDAGPFSPLDISPVASSVVGPGIGVGADAPPYLEGDYAGCTDLRGWTHQELRRSGDKWVCASFPDDGTPLLYKGLTPTEGCDSNDCLPYAGVNQLGRPTYYDQPVSIDGRVGHRVAPGYSPDTSFLWTPAFEVPIDSVSPTVLLGHQYSTDIALEDENLTSVVRDSAGRIRLNHVLNLSLEEWTQDGWIYLGPLEPAGGYSSEESTGIERVVPREYYSSSECPPGKDFALPGTDPPRFVLFLQWFKCGFTTANTSWWWPQGDQPLAYSSETGLPSGNDFPDGSPWRTDVVPLYGTHLDRPELDVVGRTLRLRFTFHGADMVRSHSQALDWGWRIGEVSVVEGDKLARDIAVVAASLDVPFDAESLGLAPETQVPVRLTLQNAGRLDLQGIKVTLIGDHVDEVTGARTELCRDEDADLPGTLLVGQARNVTTLCAIPAVPGKTISLRASARLTGAAEDFLGNNLQRVRGTFKIQTAPDLSVRVDVTPRDSILTTPRNVQIVVSNTGNNPLDDVEVKFRLLRLENGAFTPTEIHGAWTLTQPLPIVGDGVRVTASTPAEPPIDEERGLRFVLPGAGSYLVVAEAVSPETQTALAAAPAFASEVFYAESFDDAPVIDEKVITGTLDADEPWLMQPGNSHDGSGHLLAGDASTGEIPPNTDASVRLPTMDLASLRRATLSFTHRYSLEEGFDAGRIEMSMDGGASWSVVTPRSQPLNGLPRGYPETVLVGASPLQGSEVETTANAYTGTSVGLGGSQEGWLTSEIDLSRNPAFWATSVVDAFPLEAPVPAAAEQPIGPRSAPEFWHPTWTLEEPDAISNLRYWWIDNVTYAQPQPLSGSRMWWSGSSGATPASGIQPVVDTALTISVDTSGIPLSADDRLVFSFWDWRSGAGMGPNETNDGLGGEFRIETLPDGSNATTYKRVERLPSGWTKREVDLTAYAGQIVGLRFNYRSGHSPDLAFVQGGTNPLSFQPSDVQQNRGWFIDSVSLLRRRDSSEETVRSWSARDATGWSVDVVEGETEWRRMSLGAAATDGGWTPMIDVNVPGVGPSFAWRFGSVDAEGYPPNADARLVTPLVDLRQYAGDSASFHFDHRFGFHGMNTIGGLAVDGGAVEYQMFDESTGRFGDWKTLRAGDVSGAIGLTGESYSSQHGRRMGLENEEELADFSSTGYTSVTLSPFRGGVVPNDVDLITNETISVGDRRVGDYLTSFSPGAWIEWVDFEGDGVEKDGLFGEDDGLFVDLDDSETIGFGDIDLINATKQVTRSNTFFGTYVKGVRLPASAVQWIDHDLNGEWSYGDDAIVAASMVEGRGPAAAVELGDIRLTRPREGGENWTRINETSPLVGAPLSSRPVFKAFCHDDHDANSKYDDDADHVFLTTRAETCSGRLTRADQFVQGSAFNLETAWARTLPDSSLDGTNWNRPWWEREALPISYVFSGDSRAFYGGTEGWSSADWDISHLIGKQVRFGFHASTNPSREPCGEEDFFFGAEDLTYNGPPCDGDPLHGWSIANVRVEGQQFQGKPVDIRFRVATDESMQKGEWRIDDILLVGERYEEAISLTTGDADLEVPSGEDATFEGLIRNLGSQARGSIAVAVAARRADTGALVPFELSAPRSIPDLATGSLPTGFAAGLGPFSLAPGGGDGSSLPIDVNVQLPATDGVRVNVMVQLLELDPTRPCVEAPCSPSYKTIRNEPGAGAGNAVWTARGENVLALELLPPDEMRATLIVVEPTILDADAPATFAAKVRNNGTIVPDDLVAHWTIQQMERKGDPDRQRGTREQIKDSFELDDHPIEDLERGETATISAEFTPTEEGLYRVRLELTSGAVTVATATTDMRVGPLGPYYAVDFGEDDAAEVGWKDVSEQPTPFGGGTPSGLRFRDIGQALIWGVTKPAFFDGLNYCAFEGCNPTSTGNGGEPVTGLEGIAEGPLIDLGQVVGDDAIVTLRHGHVFAPGDGAAVEILPLESPVVGPPRAAFVCVSDSGDQLPAWFRLAPDPASALAGETKRYPSVTGIPFNRGVYTLPGRDNALGTGAVIGGPGVDEETIRFRLTGVPWAHLCPAETQLIGDVPPSFVNYTVQMRLRAGTTPGIVDGVCSPVRCPDNPRTGALGWQVSSISVSSVDVAIEPASRSLPVSDGQSKLFSLRVKNSGAVADTLGLAAVVPEGSVVRADWFEFPQPEVFLPPGASAVVPFRLTIPAEPRVPRGIYTAYVEASSSLDSGVSALGRLDLGLAENLLADLTVELAAEFDGLAPEPGHALRVFVTTTNLGQHGSDSVKLTLDAVNVATGQRQSLGDIEIGPLCPLSSCGFTGSSVTHAFGWLPEKAAQYRLEAVVDPAGRIIEERRDNNVALLLLDVVPLQKPDVAIKDLVLGGVQVDGFVLEGDLVTIVANVTNDGAVAATNIDVRVLAGTSELVQTTINNLNPGETRTITALQLASAGEMVIRVIALPNAADLSVANNEMRRLLRVRELAIAIEAPPGPTMAVPGEEFLVDVAVHNEGNAAERILVALNSTMEGWKLAASPNPLVVAAHSTAHVALSITAPLTAAAGAHDVLLEGSPASQPTKRVPAKLPVRLAEIGTHPTMAFVPPSVQPGPVEVEVQVQSQRNAVEGFSIALESPNWGVRPAEGATSPGSVTIVRVLALVPGTTLPGAVPIKLRLFDGLGVPRTTIDSTITILPFANGTAQMQPGLRVLDDDLVQRVMELTLEYQNTGNVPVNFSLASHGFGEGVALVPVPSVRVEPGQNVMGTARLMIENAFAESIEGHLSVLLTPILGVGQEPGTAVPVARLSLPSLVALPDLQLEGIQFYPTAAPRAGEPMIIETRIRNIGVGSSTPTDLRGFLDGTAWSDAEVPALAEGAIVTVQVPWLFADQGQHLVYLAVDGAESVAEIHDDNNGWSDIVRVREADGRIPTVPGPALGVLVVLVVVALIRVGNEERRERRRSG